MKARTRTIRNLYFRYGRLMKLEAETCARVLEGAGLITLTPDGKHYCETAKAQAIAPSNHEIEFFKTLKSWKEKQNGKI